jgi:hypothetical protein
MHVATHHLITSMIALAEGDPAAAAAAAHDLINSAITEGYVLLQIDALELLALSGTLPAETTATILAVTESSRERIGYRGRWPNLAADVIVATGTARRDHPGAYQLGTTMSLDAAVQRTAKPRL